MATMTEGGAVEAAQAQPVALPEEAIEEIRRFYGFDKPVHIRYLEWLTTSSLDLGNSYIYQEPVWDVIKSRFPISVSLGFTGFLLSYLICVPLGVLKAVRHRSRFDFVSSFLVFLGYSVPGWALRHCAAGALRRRQFLECLPLGGFRLNDWEFLTFPQKVVGQLEHMFLPVLCYMVGSFATLTILTKNSLLENLGQDYVRTAFAKGSMSAG